MNFDDAVVAERLIQSAGRLTLLLNEDKHNLSLKSKKSLKRLLLFNENYHFLGSIMARVRNLNRRRHKNTISDIFLNYSRFVHGMADTRKYEMPWNVDD